MRECADLQQWRVFLGSLPHSWSICCTSIRTTSPFSHQPFWLQNFDNCSGTMMRLTSHDCGRSSPFVVVQYVLVFSLISPASVKSGVSQRPQIPQNCFPTTITNARTRRSNSSLIFLQLLSTALIFVSARIPNSNGRRKDFGTDFDTRLDRHVFTPTSKQ